MNSLSETSTQYKFLLGSSAATFAVGLAVALRRVARRRPPYPFFKSNTGHDPNFSPVLHAAKALAMGTALCLGSATLLVGTGSYLLDVHDLPSFSHRMRSLMRRTPAPRLEEVRDVEGSAEWDRIWEEGKRLDDERAEAKRLKRARAKAGNE